MIAFEVNDMTCGRCVSAITRAVQAVDREATVQVDLATHRVEIATRAAGAAALSAAIEQAGYTPVPLADAPARIFANTAPQRSGCCCRQA